MFCEFKLQETNKNMNMINTTNIEYSFDDVAKDSFGSYQLTFNKFKSSIKIRITISKLGIAQD